MDRQHVSLVARNRFIVNKRGDHFRNNLSKSMVRTLRSVAVCRNFRWITTGLLLALVSLVLCLTAEAQQVHYRHTGDMPPGAIGQWQLQRGGPLPGYFQPTKVQVPEGCAISFADGRHFDQGVKDQRAAGLLIGQVYRLKITHIPLYEGLEVFPTIELIDRIYPPAGRALEFPIPIHITRDDLREALAGRMVTRVFYVEDPAHALPAAQQPNESFGFDVKRGRDPLRVADSLGRPVAILRLGARVPGPRGPTPQFLFGSPPWKKMTPLRMPVTSLGDSPIQRTTTPLERLTGK